MKDHMTYGHIVLLVPSNLLSISRSILCLSFDLWFPKRISSSGGNGSLSSDCSTIFELLDVTIAVRPKALHLKIGTNLASPECVVGAIKDGDECCKLVRHSGFCKTLRDTTSVCYYTLSEGQKKGRTKQQESY